MQKHRVLRHQNPERRRLPLRHQGIRSRAAPVPLVPSGASGDRLKSNRQEAGTCGVGRGVPRTKPGSHRQHPQMVCSKTSCIGSGSQPPLASQPACLGAGLPSTGWACPLRAQAPPPQVPGLERGAPPIHWRCQPASRVRRHGLGWGLGTPLGTPDTRHSRAETGHLAPRGA